MSLFILYLTSLSNAFICRTRLHFYYFVIRLLFVIELLRLCDIDYAA